MIMGEIPGPVPRCDAGYDIDEILNKVEVVDYKSTDERPHPDDYPITWGFDDEGWLLLVPETLPKYTIAHIHLQACKIAVRCIKRVGNYRHGMYDVILNEVNGSDVESTKQYKRGEEAKPYDRVAHLTSCQHVTFEPDKMPPCFTVHLYLTNAKLEVSSTYLENNKQWSLSIREVIE